ncbi:MAG: ABC transporter permease [Nitrospirae bacterium]|nr:ABC transporter permease [Nitrospirota bacterium]
MTVLEKVKEYLLVVQEFSLLSFQAFLNIFKKPRYVHEIIFQMDGIGIGSIFIVVLTGIFTGMVLALQTSTQLEIFGASIYVGKIVSLSMVRELGPVLAALMVAGRVGSGIAAEIGSMVVTEQIDAMKVEGTDPIKRLVTPRLVACIIMFPMLAVLCDIVGIFGGSLIAIFTLKLGAVFYWNQVFDILRYPDLISGFSKPVVFGFIVAMVGSFVGLRTTGGTEGVGRSTTKSVVASCILILITDFFMTKLFFAIL